MRKSVLVRFSGVSAMLAFSALGACTAVLGDFEIASNAAGDAGADGSAVVDSGAPDSAVDASVDADAGSAAAPFKCSVGTAQQLDSRPSYMQKIWASRGTDGSARVVTRTPFDTVAAPESVFRIHVVGADGMPKPSNNVILKSPRPDGEGGAVLDAKPISGGLGVLVTEYDPSDTAKARLALYTVMDSSSMVPGTNLPSTLLTASSAVADYTGLQTGTFAPITSSGNESYYYAVTRPGSIAGGDVDLRIGRWLNALGTFNSASTGPASDRRMAFIVSTANQVYLFNERQPSQSSSLYWGLPVDPTGIAASIPPTPLGNGFVAVAGEPSAQANFMKLAVLELGTTTSKLRVGALTDLATVSSLPVAFALQPQSFAGPVDARFLGTDFLAVGPASNGGLNLFWYDIPTTNVRAVQVDDTKLLGGRVIQSASFALLSVSVGKAELRLFWTEPPAGSPAVASLWHAPVVCEKK